MRHFINCKFTKKDGSEVNINNISNISWSVDRATAPNGHVGMKGHRIYNIGFQRIRSLQNENVAQLENETIELASATEQKAYFDGEITVARADDANDIIQTIRWKNGHICDLKNDIDGDEITEIFEVSVTSLEINDSEFKRNVTA